jgi:hypothetical protein
MIPPPMPRLGPDLKRPSTVPLHPLLLGAWLVLNAQVDTGVALQSTLRVWAVVLVGSLTILGAWFLVTRRWGVAGIGASATIWLLASRDLDRLWLGLIAVAAVVAALVVLQRLARGRISMAGMTRGANLVAGILVILTIVRGVANGTLLAAVGDLTGSLPELGSVSEGSLPDIYLVILDGYPRADVMSDVTGVDNTPFLAALEERGFDVATESSSSYMYSDLLGAALFHGRHLVDIRDLDPLRDGETRPALGRQVLNSAPLIARLRELGYLAVANAQAWDEPSLRAVDVYIEGTGFNEFERQMWWSSLPGSLMELRGPTVYQNGIEPWVHDAFAAFDQVTQMTPDRPRFAFIHVPSPHFPIIFEADGSRADAVFGRDHPDQVSASDEDVRAAYAGQVTYLNSQLLDSLDGASLPEDAIVILMSDHGPEFGLDWFNGGSSDLQTRFGAFFAARAPEGVFTDDANVAEAMLEVVRYLDHNTDPGLADRYFVTNAVQKLATMREVPDPWASD